MSTVFFKVLKQVLTPLIQGISLDSFAKDKAGLNVVFTWVGLGRNTKVSEKKRNIATDMYLKVFNFPGTHDDRANYDTFMSIISVARDGATAARIDGQVPNDGGFGKKTTLIREIAESFYKKCGQYDLLDITDHDKDPFSILTHQAMSYLLTKIVQEKTPPSLFGKLKSQATFPLTLEKEQLLVKELHDCRDTLMAFEISKPNYKHQYKETVIKAIGCIISGNGEACQKSAVNLGSVPIISLGLGTVSVSTPNAAPDPGNLKELLLLALNSIKELKESEIITNAAGYSPASRSVSSSSSSFSSSFAPPFAPPPKVRTEKRVDRKNEKSEEEQEEQEEVASEGDWQEGKPYVT